MHVLNVLCKNCVASQYKKKGKYYHSGFYKIFFKNGKNVPLKYVSLGLK